MDSYINKLIEKYEKKQRNKIRFKEHCLNLLEKGNLSKNEEIKYKEKLNGVESKLFLIETIIKDLKAL